MFEIIIFILIMAGLGLWLLIHAMARSSNPVARWAAVLIPPLLLLYLVTIPIDIITLILWGGAWLICAFSVSHILYLGATTLVSKLSNKPLHLKRIGFQAIRPCLCIVCVGVSYTMVNLSLASANYHAIELAIEMQKQVAQTGDCLPPPAQFAADNDRTMTTKYGKYGTQYRMYYLCNNTNGTFFRILVHNAQDISFSVSSTDGADLIAEFGDYDNLKQVQITKDTDLHLLARKEIQ